MQIVLGLSFWLRLGVGTIKEKRYDLFEDLLTNVYSAVDMIGGFHPIHLTHGDFPGHGFSAITELDVYQVAAEDYSHAVKRIVVPRGRLARRQPLSPYQVVTAMMQHFLLCHEVHSVSLRAPHRNHR